MCFKPEEARVVSELYLWNKEIYALTRQILHQASSTKHPPPSILHQASSTKHPPPSTLHQASSTKHPPPSILHQAPSTKHPSSSILHQTSFIKHLPTLQSKSIITTYPSHLQTSSPNKSQSFNFNHLIILMSVASSPQLAGLPDTHSLSCPDRDCQLEFSNFGDLYEHYDGFHPLFIKLPGKIKQYKCPFCSKTYKTERYMRGHTNTHISKLPGSAEDQDALFLQSRIAMARKQRSQAPTTNENTPNHNSQHESQGSEAQASSTIITQQTPDPTNSTQPTFTAQRKRKGSPLLTPPAKKATPHKVILDEMAVTEEGDLILPITQTVRKMYPGNHASSYYSSTAHGRPWAL